ncbi:phosphoribosylanthranilate isomerase [Methanothermobacter tenebrarum]|uniref:N-(5'-phosphoribosyl)anthranilate isomerase n=1 Tax=Methanothermobacter tenebrarum TaxID=680118 RepID=A0A328PH66_9EURY|nr:phosphoribosylanthranilate isomerase [Methanothermobacter tenebrarum]MBC7100860.1 phosphoribosylanthranilate isomerase [Methanobacteriales archaeon]NPV64001.1 phosphoribosylanthranilate isomerase [Methanobacteriaceae archaeon]RAO79175.1 phosphoribosylanthranilate isomerase [Methanothermobacter tenebrarum]
MNEIKICGITNRKDLKLINNKVDYIGFINVKRSPRYLPLSKIIELVTDKEKAVLVLEPKNPEEVIEKVEKTSISNVQLHSFKPSQIKKLKVQLPENILLIKAVGIPEKLSPKKKKEIKSFAKVSDAILFDYELQGKTGGTGIQIPLDIACQAANIATRAKRDIKLFLAGGMNLQTLKKNYKLINSHFDVVDFNSSLEKSPGIKDPNKIKELLNYVNKVIK